MPRDPNGVHSLPAGYRAVDGETALASQHNPALEDLSAETTASLPRSGVAGMLGNLNMGGNKVTGAANATLATDLVPKAQMDAAILASSMPPGVVSPYAGATTPAGWLLCNGQAVSRTTYASLFAVIATTYGTGDGSTTFNVPDLRGEFIRGLDAGRGVDTGRALGSAQADELEAHGHTTNVTLNDPGHGHIIDAEGSLVYGASGAVMTAFDSSIPGGPNTTRSVNSSTTGITVGVTVNNTGGSETRPRNVALNFIIKT